MISYFFNVGSIREARIVHFFEVPGQEQDPLKENKELVKTKDNPDKDEAMDDSSLQKAEANKEVQKPKEELENSYQEKMQKAIEEANIKTQQEQKIIENTDLKSSQMNNSLADSTVMFTSLGIDQRKTPEGRVA
ncbi:MAG: hypothetical protein RIQ56_531 [Candidatus Parcubacteria bacterium]|jgi:hypothetical protein